MIAALARLNVLVRHRLIAICRVQKIGERAGWRLPPVRSMADSTAGERAWQIGHAA